MKKFQKIFSAGLCLTAFLCSIPIPAQAADAPKIVVVGDGISSGAKLAEGEKSYADLIAEYTGAQIQNFAQDTYMTGDVLASLNDAQVQKALSEADIILVTAGINDVMIPFFELTNSYIEEFGVTSLEDIFNAKLQDYGFTSEDELTPYANSLASAARSNKKTATENFKQITENLSQYQNAKVIYQTVYNATDTIEKFDQLSAKRQSAYDSIRNPITSTLNSSYNKLLTSLNGTGNAVVVDTFTGFQGLAYQYTNLNQVDANPTAEGHAWIADAVMAAAGLEKSVSEPDYGDLNHDGTVDAADAAELLKAAANLGAGKPSGLSEELEKAARITNDDTIDAADAAVILVYAAGKGSGAITVSFNEYRKTL